MSTVTTIGILTMCTGFIIGFTAQRSRMCFIAGIRDFILVRDRELLQGLFAFLMTVWIFTSILYGTGMLEKGIPQFGGPPRQEKLFKSYEEFKAENENSIILLGADEKPVPLKDVFNRFLLSSLAGGFLIGFFTVTAGGCVLRQHVLTAQGSRDSLFFIIGFYGAVPLFYLLLSRYAGWFYT
jgi:uncharacterized protein